MNYTVVINSAVWFGALAYYYIDARKWFTGPKITIDVGDLTEEQEVAIREEGLDVAITEKPAAENAGGESGIATGISKGDVNTERRESSGKEGSSDGDIEKS